MAKLQQDNIGAQSQDGIMARVGMTFLNPNRTILMLPLQEHCPTDDEMVVQGEATYSIDRMFKALQPAVNVTLLTGDDSFPMENVDIEFKSMKNFEPDDIVDRLPTLRKMKDQQSLINRLEQLLQEGSFKKIMEDGTKKAALLGFLKSIIADIEVAESEEDA
jgi:predicted component of type VI protein secretion system